MTATCHRAEVPTYLEFLRDESDRLVAVAEDADPSREVPACPGWSVADVVDHVGGLYRWAEAHIRTLSDRRIRARELELEKPEDPLAHGGWVRDGMTLLIETARAADPDAAVWAWGSDRHVRFWPRRMLFETVIHRADLELALGWDPDIAPDIATDGVDEFLDNLPHAAYFAPAVQDLRGNGETMRWRASDPETTWAVHLTMDGFIWTHDDAEGVEAAVDGAAAQVLLDIYGRPVPGLTTTGDAALLARWRTGSAL